MKYQVINCGSHYKYGEVLQEFDSKAEADAYVLKLGDRSILAKVIPNLELIGNIYENPELLEKPYVDGITRIYRIKPDQTYVTSFNTPC